jgi:hypothetical protein
MQLTSSQQSSIKSANPNISPYSLLLYVSFLVFSFFFLSFFHNKLLQLLQLFVCAYDLDKQQTVLVYLYPIVVWKSDVLRGLLLIQ